jgi:hypothetical protein
MTKTKKTKCYMYTRVSTAIQVDGYSLEAQKEKMALLHKIQLAMKFAAMKLLLSRENRTLTVMPLLCTSLLTLLLREMYLLSSSLI